MTYTNSEQNEAKETGARAWDRIMGHRWRFLERKLTAIAFFILNSIMGAKAANKIISEVAERFAREIVRRLPRQALTRTAYYPLIKQISKWIAINVTKNSFARSVSKFVPIVGGLVSAGVTAAMMKPMAKRLKNHLRELRLAHPDGHDG